jgi:nucleotide-binding universal stress UspA family protein
MARLLIAYDASHEARRAIRAAGALHPGAEVVILNVAESPSRIAPLGTAGVPIAGPGAPPPPPEHLIESEQEAEREARETAEEGVREAQAMGLNAQPATGWGAGASTVTQAILQSADEHGADLVVVGSRGRSGIKAAFLGSVSNALVQQAHIPVLIVPHGA